MKLPEGAVACGHPVTAAAAVVALEAGGNAFDAAAAAVWAACVAEPFLASPGGGGFLLARPAGSIPRVYDFFTQTPLTRLPPGKEDFREIHADFGTTRQAFHIGLGSAATPGLVAGTWAFQEELGRLPAAAVLEPAIRAARDGVPVTEVGGYLARVLAPILDATPEVRRIFSSGGRPLQAGDLHLQPELADLLEGLGKAGPSLFYEGAVAEAVDRGCRRDGGHLRTDDFREYRVIRRAALETEFLGARVWTNPPPATGGALVGFGLRVLAGLHAEGHPGLSPPERVAVALAATQEARLREGIDRSDASSGPGDASLRGFLDPATVARYREAVLGRARSFRGTTHISVLDREGNAASVTLSNGEGSGWVVPGAGFMLNNMLGEEDLQPGGFGRWPTGRRLTSMMAPTLVERAGGSETFVLGSGGSNRIRSAIFQVLSGILESGLSPDEAVLAPRLHLEGASLDMEAGLPPDAVRSLITRWPDHRIWEKPNLFFGGVHLVWGGAGGLQGVGDPRRGGVAAIA